MSLGPTYVRADDGEFYKNPVIRGEGFFLCFDEDEPPELVIEVGAGNFVMAERMDEIIKQLGLKASFKQGPHRSTRCFGKLSDKGSMRPAYAYFLNIHAPIPVSIITEHEGVYDGHGEGTFECFDSGFNLKKYLDSKK